MAMRGFNFYRYGFNGYEKDDEIKGGGNSYVTHHRLLDPRIGRWFSTDPLGQFVGSQYSLNSNNPILLIDPDGGWVITIGSNTSADFLVGTGEAEGGIVIGSDGIAAYGSYSYGLQGGSLAGVSKSISVTIYPDMPKIKLVSGPGNTLQLTAGVPVGPQFSVASVQSGNYIGINLQAGLGASYGLPVNISFTWDETTVRGLESNDKRFKEQALSAIGLVSNDVDSQLKQLFESNSNTAKERSQCGNGDGTIGLNDPNYDKWKKLNNKIKENNSQIGELKDMKKTLDEAEKKIETL
jgi:RHS repeat-associated protein